MRFAKRNPHRTNRGRVIERRELAKATSGVLRIDVNTVATIDQVRFAKRNPNRGRLLVADSDTLRGFAVSDLAFPAIVMAWPDGDRPDSSGLSVRGASVQALPLDSG